MIGPHYMFNPLKFGLLSGASDMFGGLAHGLQMQMVLNNRLAAYHERYSQMANVQQAREEHNMLLAKMKMQQDMMKQKSSVVTGPDGKLYKEYSHFSFDPNSNSYNRVLDGREPIQTSQEKQQAAFDQANKMEQARGSKQDRIDARNQSRLDAKERDAATKATNAKIAAAQKQLNRVKDRQQNAIDAFNKDFDKNPSNYSQAMQDAGLDPTDPKDRAKFRAMHAADIADQHSGDLKDAQSDLDSATSEKEQSGKAAPKIKYGPDGTPYVKGPDGKPVPYQGNAADTESGEGEEGIADTSDDQQGGSVADQTAPAPPGDLNDPITQQYLALASEPDSFTAAKPPDQEDQEDQQGSGLMGIEQQMQSDRNRGDAEFAQAGAEDDNQQGLMSNYG